MKKDDDIQRLFGKRERPKPQPKSYRSALFWGVGSGLIMAIVLLMVFSGFGRDVYFFNTILSIALGSIVGLSIGFLRFTLHP